MNYSKMKYIKLFEESNRNDILDILCELANEYGFSINTWYDSYQLVSNAPQERYKDGNPRPKCRVNIDNKTYTVTGYDIDNERIIIKIPDLFTEFGRDLLEVGIMIGLRINDIDKWAEIMEKDTVMYDYLTKNKIKLSKEVDNHFSYLKNELF